MTNEAIVVGMYELLVREVFNATCEEIWPQILDLYLLEAMDELGWVPSA